MNTKNLWIAVLSGAALTTLVSNLPFVDMVNILCFAGFWGGAIFAVWLYRRLTGSVIVRQAVTIGLLTGVISGILGFALSFLGVAGMQGLMSEFSQETDSIPLWGAMVFNFLGVVFNIFFGTIGGWIGGSIFRTDRVTQNPPSSQAAK